jgi:hypothetical protein
MARWGWIAIVVALVAAVYTTQNKKDGKDDRT